MKRSILDYERPERHWVAIVIAIGMLGLAIGEPVTGPRRPKR